MNNPLQEQADFNRRAAQAIYLQGRLVAQLELDPDTTTAEQVEVHVIAALKRLPVVERMAAEQAGFVERLRHDIENIKTTNRSQGQTLAAFREAMEELRDELDLGRVKEVCERLLKIRDDL